MAEWLLNEQVLNNGIFAILSIWLLVYTLKNNKEREQEFFKVLEHQGEVLKEQANKLSQITSILQNLVVRIEKLEEKIDKNKG